MATRRCLITIHSFPTYQPAYFTCLAANNLPWYLLITVKPPGTWRSSYQATGIKKSRGLAKPLAPRTQTLLKSHRKDVHCCTEKKGFLPCQKPLHNLLSLFRDSLESQPHTFQEGPKGFGQKKKKKNHENTSIITSIT